MGDEYSFLQETIKDEEASPKTLRKKICRMILLGFVFGIVACVTFFALKPWIDDTFGQKEVSIPEDEEIETVIEQVENIEEQERKQVKYLKKIQDVAKTGRLSLVKISGQKKLEKNAEKLQTSGVIVADNGADILILAQSLSKKELKHINVTFSDGETYPASLVKQDNNIGIGIYAVAREKLKNSTKEFSQVIELGNSRYVQNGDTVIFIGNCSEHDFLTSYGFVTSNDTKVEISDGFVDIICADMAGAVYKNGILLNQDGKMIGMIDTAHKESDTLVIAYSISDIKKEIEYMSNGRAVPYAGIRGTALPDKLKEEGLEAGIYVKDIDVDSPALEAGIQCGDVITYVDDTQITDMKEYRKALLTDKKDGNLLIKGLRKGADNEYVEMEFHINVGAK